MPRGEQSQTDPPKGVTEKELDRLYHGPIEEFTSRRNELAKSLKDDGKGDAATWVKGLKKPTRAAWLVNQLSERKPAEVKKLLKVGEDLRRGQEELLAGTADPDKLRAASEREQKSVDSLLRTAEAIGREHKAGSQILDRVGETLQAASSDPEVAAAIEQGRLDRERRASGLGLVGPATPRAPAKSKTAREKQAAERKASQQEAKRRKEAERKVAAAERALEREEAAVEKARDALEEREKRVKDAEHDLRAARRDLDEI
jgi:DNA repair exonuclease SbcCD ATPase subunit